MLKNALRSLKTLNGKDYHDENQYLHLIDDILKEGEMIYGRNGNAKTVCGSSMHFSLQNGTLPLLTTKKVAWKTCLRELLWFISGNTNNDTLREQKVGIWNGNGSREFLDSRGLTHYRDNDLGPVYGHQWRHFNAPYTNCDADYTGKGVDQLQYIIDQLKNYDNTEVIMMGEDKKYSYAMWRFLVADDEDVEIFLCRDADSRLSYRERYCVGIFEDSDYLVHSIRDNINHGALLAGMWGMKNNKRTSMKNLIQNFDGNLDYGQDEVFLRNIFGPHYDDTTLIHCSTRLENFPIENDISKYKIEPLNEGHKHFVGEVFCHTNYGRPYNHIFY